MILNEERFRSNSYDSSTFVTENQLVKLLDKADQYKEDLLKAFPLDSNTRVINIGNAKNLIGAISALDDQCEKIDIDSKIKDIQLQKMLDGEKALFDIFSIKNDFILKQNESDQLLVETKYSAKADILDYYNLSKFANYCRDNDYEDLIGNIRDYLKAKNSKNNSLRSLRIIYKYEDEKFYLRAFTSSGGYKNYGINFSIFVALMAIGKYVEKNQIEVYIDHYSVDDSNLYVSFAFPNEYQVNENLSLSFSLILENDEVKRNAVSFNGLVKLNFKDNERRGQIYLLPSGVKKEGNIYPVDLLTYPHRGSVMSVVEKVADLPEMINFFINQLSEDAKRVSSIENPDDVKKYIAYKIRGSRKEEFKEYKEKIFQKLMKINVDNTFMLFSVLREVEDLFEHKDIIALNFWRNKLYETLVEKK